MKTVNVYKCKSCHDEFEVDQKDARYAVCPNCGSTNIKFVKVEKTDE